MNDTNERSVGSTGSGPLGIPMFAPEWRERAKSMTFYGISASELSRDDLLAAVGYLADKIEQERAAHASTLGIMQAAATRLVK
jgi:hypothetical protein